MTEKQYNAFNKLSELTVEKCNSCPSGDVYRCCDKMFCKITNAHHKDKELVYEYDTTKEIPFIGENGCVIPPEDRPFCVGFVCNHILDDRELRRKYERLCIKAGIPQSKR